MLASTTYRELVERNEWRGNNKGNALVCFQCGNDRHIIRDCPDKDAVPSVPSAPVAAKGWTRVKPTNGNSSLHKHDKTWYWCDKCGRWNLTHITDKHVKKTSSDTSSSATTSSSSVNLSSVSSSPSDAVQSLNFAHLILEGLQKS